MTKVQIEKEITFATKKVIYNKSLISDAENGIINNDFVKRFGLSSYIEELKHNLCVSLKHLENLNDMLISC